MRRHEPLVLEDGNYVRRGFILRPSSILGDQIGISSHVSQRDPNKVAEVIDANPIHSPCRPALTASHWKIGGKGRVLTGSNPVAAFAAID